MNSSTYTAVSAFLVILLILFITMRISDTYIEKVYKTSKIVTLDEIGEFHVPKGYYLGDLTIYTTSAMGFASTPSFGFKCASTKALLNLTPDYADGTLFTPTGFKNWKTDVLETTTITKGSYNNFNGPDFTENPKADLNSTTSYFKITNNAQPTSGEDKFHVYYELWSLGDY